jgi:hypothetical protein
VQLAHNTSATVRFRPHAGPYPKHDPSMSREHGFEVMGGPGASRRIECHSACAAWSYNAYGELQPEVLRALDSVAALDTAPHAGRSVPQGGVPAGRWFLEYHGPNISVSHEDHPDQQLLLDAEGFELHPGISPTALLLDLPHLPTLKVWLSHHTRVRRVQMCMHACLCRYLRSCRSACFLIF